MIVTQNTNSNPMSYFGLRTILLTGTTDTTIPVATSEFFEDESPSDDPCSLNCPQLVLAESTFTSVLNNDFNSFLYQLPLNTSTILLTLQKWNGMVWIDQTTLIDDTYGEHFATGFYSVRDTFSGFRVDWDTILTAFGTGIYKIKNSGTYFGNAYLSYSEMFCLKNYSVNTANDTVRFEWGLNNIFQLSSGKSLDVSLMDFKQSMRVTGIFNEIDSDEDKVEIEYQNRQVDVVRDELIRKFTFTSGRLPQWLHVRLRDIAFLSNTEPIITGTGTNYKLDSNLRVTDYNKNQEVVFERFNIVRDGGYPMSSEINSLLKRTAVNFKAKIVTPRHRLCE
jgi:hypothetical protein|tara:strand:- start:662 stop:1669 length:1008 start_codon:yes stop_codon:yes gene_type:complete